MEVEPSCLRVTKPWTGGLTACGHPCPHLSQGWEEGAPSRGWWAQIPGSALSGGPGHSQPAGGCESTSLGGFPWDQGAGLAPVTPMPGLLPGL